MATHCNSLISEKSMAPLRTVFYTLRKHRYCEEWVSHFFSGVFTGVFNFCALDSEYLAMLLWRNFTPEWPFCRTVLTWDWKVKSSSNRFLFSPVWQKIWLFWLFSFKLKFNSYAGKKKKSLSCSFLSPSSSLVTFISRVENMVVFSDNFSVRL